MAKSALELAVNTGQWDAGLKKAVQSLNNFTEANGGLTQTLNSESQKMQKFVSMMGSMESSAKTAKGQMNDYKSAIEQLTMQYNRMTDAQKKTIGQDYLASIDKLKQKYQGVQESVNSMNKELSSSGGLKDALDAVAGKFGLSIDQVTKFGGVLAVTGAALKVAKDAFFASEATVDEWGRTVAASESVYEGFLNALNNMDISGFLGRIDEIVAAARKAYDELDRLGTMKTIQSPAMSAQQTENERMRAILQTGRWIGAADGRQSSLGYKNGDIVSKEHLKIIEQQLKNGMNNMVTLVGREVKQTTKAIDAVYERQGAELGMSVKEFRKGTSSMAEFDKRIALAAKYNEYESQHTNTVYNPATGGWSPKRDNSKNPYEAYKGWDVFRVDGDRYKGLVQLIQQRDQQMSQMYGMQSQAYRTINRVEGTTVRNIMNGGSGGGSTGGKGGGTTTTAATEKEVTIQQQIAKLEQEAYTASDERRAEIAKQVQELDKVLAAQKAIRDEVHGTVKEQQMATGISGLTPEMIATGQADIKKQMQSVEYGTQEYNDLAQRLIDYNTVSNLLQEAVKSGLEVDEDVRESFATALLNGVAIPDEVKESFVDDLNELRELIGENPLVLNIETGQVATAAKKVMTEAQKTQQAWNLASQSVNNMGNALNAIDDPSAKAAGTVIKAISDIALGFAQASKAADTTASGWAWLAWLAAGTAAMATTISTVHSLTGFANGGIVQGNSYSGDNVGPVMLDAGEVVLNRAQVGNLAEQLEDNDNIGGIGGTPYVTGEQIYLGLNNYLKGAGLGSLVTSQG